MRLRAPKASSPQGKRRLKSSWPLSSALPDWRPVLAAVRRGATIAFASKECLVSAGDYMMREVAKYGARLLPVDSEHNAIYQVFDNANRDSIVRLILTASGGPFRSWTKAQMAVATPEQAVAHPNWSMGAKISVDSAHHDE